MKKNLSLFLFLTLSIPGHASAWIPVLLSNPAPGAGNTLQDFIYLLIEIIQLIGFPILVCCIIYAGFLMVTASGNEQQVTKAKSWILWTLVGALIILGAKVIADFIYGTAILF